MSEVQPLLSVRTVGESTSACLPEISDADLRAQVVEQLGHLSQFFPIWVHVRVEGGQVDLRGGVSSLEERGRILESVMALEGVKGIRDHLQLGIRSSADFDDGDPSALLASLFQIGVVWAAVAIAVTAWWMWPRASLIAAQPQPVPAIVEFGGMPATGAVLTLHPLDASASSAVLPQGLVGRDGSVEWTTYQPGDGLPPGRYLVTAQWNPTLVVNGQSQPSPNLLSDALSRPATSPLRLHVSSDQQTPWKIDLK
ncbi:BON domain-containing protein [Planctomicrobium piriforme]|nr:BON domain-containing protein [Planctomicrobium piriforme]